MHSWKETKLPRVSCKSAKWCGLRYTAGNLCVFPNIDICKDNSCRWCYLLLTDIIMFWIVPFGRLFNVGSSRFPFVPWMILLQKFCTCCHTYLRTLLQFCWTTRCGHCMCGIIQQHVYRVLKKWLLRWHSLRWTASLVYLTTFVCSCVSSIIQVRVQRCLGLWITCCWWLRMSSYVWLYIVQFCVKCSLLVCRCQHWLWNARLVGIPLPLLCLH